MPYSGLCLFSGAPAEGGASDVRTKRPAPRLVKGIVGSATFSFDLSGAGGLTDVVGNRRSVNR